MRFDWPEDTPEKFSHEIISAKHDWHKDEKFSDDGIADLLDRYPRENLGLYSFPDHAEGRVKAMHGRALDLSGAELIRAVKKGRIWLNLRAVNKYLPEYEEIKQRLFSNLDSAAHIKTLKQDVGVLISSPHIHVHYHLDIPLVCLVQLRGEKTVYLYPAKAPFATAEQIEAVVLREQEEEMLYQHGFEDYVAKIDMKPGDAITWPQNAPHRVQNSDMMNVSLSCEYMTPTALLRANALYTNGVLRRSMGMDATLPKGGGVDLLSKAILARGIKLFRKTPDKQITPITFEIDKNTLEVTPLQEIVAAE
ncbi:hypothetical protein [Hirschia litorea]|uniref:JmjC domain-containing protein n=1 Tax=Hirschia litorea TaxID=1199156 RepID=A0ABW2II86_9PROT